MENNINLNFSTAKDLAEYIALPYSEKIGTLETDSILNDIYKRAYISADRWWNEGTKTYSKYSKISEIDYKYNPISSIVHFELPTFLVDKNKINIHLANPTENLKKLYIKENEIVMPVHPEVINDPLPYLQEIKKNPFKILKAIPSSSSRSVAIDINYFHTNKLSLPRKISRYIRYQSSISISHSVNISKALTSINLEKFGYLPETIGISFPDKNNQKGWGFILREMVPRNYVNEQRLLIPFFSLFSENPIIPNGEPLLVTLIKNSKEDPKEYILKYILLPLIESFAKVYEQQGILMELHAQNTLLEIDQHLKPTRIIHRDLNNWVDGIYREQLGLSNKGLNPERLSIPVEYSPKGGPHSLIYDSSIGHHLLDYLASLMEKYFHIKSEELQIPCRDSFKEILNECLLENFPPTIYYYGDKPAKNNEFPLIDTGKKPKWRPVD